MDAQLFPTQKKKIHQSLSFSSRCVFFFGIHISPLGGGFNPMRGPPLASEQLQLQHITSVGVLGLLKRMNDVMLQLSMNKLSLWYSIASTMTSTTTVTISITISITITSTISIAITITETLTVDGRNPAPVEVGSLSQYLTGFFSYILGGCSGFQPSTVLTTGCVYVHFHQIPELLHKPEGVVTETCPAVLEKLTTSKVMLLSRVSG